jgi:large subunit ribosomal protein L25
MRKDITVAAEKRDTRGKNEARRLRVTDRIPAIVYGTGKDPVAVSVNPKELNRILHSSTGHNTIFNVDIQGMETSPVMIVDWQNDPIKGTLLHADLKRIDLGKRLKVKVPVRTHGDPKGVKVEGGLFEVVTREIEIECLPDEIPEHFDISVVELMIGENKRASEVALSGSMKLVSSPDTVLAHVVAMRGAVETAPEEATPAAPAEPEVIKKGKKEEEGAEPEKKK